MARTKKPDWTAIKTEYATGTLSYAKLAAKYKIPIRTITDRGRADGWVTARKDYRSKCVAKTIDAASDREAERGARIMSAADKLMDCVEAALSTPEAAAELASNPKGLKAVAEAIAKVKDIQDIRSQRDLAEQDARIANLRKQADKDDSKADDVTVELMGELSEYAE